MTAAAPTALYQSGDWLQEVHASPALGIVQAVRRPAWYEVASTVIRESISLDHDWDRMGGAPPSNEAVSTAFTFLKMLRDEEGLMAVILPSSDGGFIFELAPLGAPNAEPLIIDIEPDGSLSYD